MTTYTRSGAHTTPRVGSAELGYMEVCLPTPGVVPDVGRLTVLLPLPASARHSRIRPDAFLLWIRRYCILLSALVIATLTACGRSSSEPPIYTQPTPDPQWATLASAPLASSPEWTEEELTTLRNLWIGSLPPLPPDPTNAVADDPRAAELGHHLFFDARLSANNQISCATCHIPQRTFADGLPTAHGTRPNLRHTPSIVGSAYAPWLLWDGHKESLWAQAVEPIEAIDEHGTTRLQAIHLLANDAFYRSLYEEIFGPLPNLNDYARFPDFGGPVDFLDYRDSWETMTPADQEAATQVFINMGKAIAAYERLINPGVSPFDIYVESLLRGDTKTADATLTTDEVAGLRLFIGAANCVRCHSGPLFSDFQFHNTGVPTADGQIPDPGRAAGLEAVLADEFNCQSQYSDGSASDCHDAFRASKEELGRESLIGALRTPMLRNVAESAPYMHSGQFATLLEVLVHYRNAPAAAIGRSTIGPLALTDQELRELEAFLRTLSGPIRAADELLEPPASE